MNIAIISAAGKQGSLLVTEALKRGHSVTAFVRKSEDSKKLDAKAKVMVKDILSLKTEDLNQFEVVLDAFGTWAPETLHLHKETLRHLADLVENTETRLLVVGGAGSLFVDSQLKTRVMDLPSFPSDWLPVAASMGEAFDELKTRTGVKWTYISPPALFDFEGKRTGSYILGGDTLLVDGNGNSEISYADYAIAMIDEAEKAKHIGQRITVCGR
jgi:putative NADH-flavin reductase